MFKIIFKVEKMIKHYFGGKNNQFFIEEEAK
jgi:hypothetical protein